MVETVKNCCAEAANEFIEYVDSSSELTITMKDPEYDLVHLLTVIADEAIKECESWRDKYHDMIPTSEHYINSTQKEIDQARKHNQENCRVHCDGLARIHSNRWQLARAIVERLKNTRKIKLDLV
jgi:hypothetical protein